MSLAFRHAIVVGASSGIGAEIARQLAGAGCSVALLGRRAEELEKVRAEIAGRGRGSAIVAVHDATAHPSPASWRAICAPMPELAPTTMAWRNARLMDGSLGRTGCLEVGSGETS